MSLQEYTYLSVSVAATLISIVLVVGLVMGFMLFDRVNKILNQFEAVAQMGLATSQALKEFVDKTTSQASNFMQTFLTLKGAKEVIGYVSEAIQKVKQNRKENKNAKSSDE